MLSYWTSLMKSNERWKKWLCYVLKYVYVINYCLLVPVKRLIYNLNVLFFFSTSIGCWSKTELLWMQWVFYTRVLCDERLWLTHNRSWLTHELSFCPKIKSIIIFLRKSSVHEKPISSFLFETFPTVHSWTIIIVLWVIDLVCMNNPSQKCLHLQCCCECFSNVFSMFYLEKHYKNIESWINQNTFQIIKV